MKRLLLLVSFGLTYAIVALSAQGKTTMDGVYTAAQAARGEKVYSDSCASCHQTDLSGGGQTPELAGQEFNSDFKDLPLSDLFDRTRLTMPADKPGSLTPNQAADLIAFLLLKATFPAGQTELPPDIAALKTITFIVPK